jgi:protein TonB
MTTDAMNMMDERAARLLPVGREWIGLGVVVALHAVALAGMTMLVPSKPEVVVPPTISGVLVQAPEPVVEPRPLPVQPKPEPKPQPKPKVRPKPTPPPPKAPPSERAVSAPPPEPPAPARSSEPVAASAPPAPAPVAREAAPAPVQPPRSDAAHLNNPAPRYPAMSRRMGEQGRVLFDVHILPDGSVGEIKLKKSSGYARLDEAALEAVRRWRYVPAKRGDTPIPFWYVQPVTFALDE